MFRKPILLILIVLAFTTLACRAASQGGSTRQETASSGAEIFQDKGCLDCHGKAGSAFAPSLAGIYGREVLLESGETLMADEAYIRESILTPDARIVRGYRNIMPAFQGRLTEEQLEALVDYIRQLE